MKRINASKPIDLYTYLLLISNNVASKSLYERFEDVPFLQHLRGGCSWQELEQAVVGNLKELPSIFPTIRSLEEYVENQDLPEGAYLLEKPPYESDFQTLQRLPISKGNLETDILLIDSSWYVNLRGIHDSLPKVLHAIKNSGVYKAEMHSHPGYDELASFPSDEDLDFSIDTLDGNHEVFYHNGLFRYNTPSNLPISDGIDSNTRRAHMEAWRYFILEEKGIKNEDDFNGYGPIGLKKEFLSKYYGLEYIGWDESRIKDLLQSKERL